MHLKQSLVRRVLPALIAEACALYASNALAAQAAQPAATATLAQSAATGDASSSTDTQGASAARPIRADVLRREQALAVPVSDVVRLGRYAHLDGAAMPFPVDVLVQDMLALAGVAPLADRDITTLSGGEFARVQFARALAQLWTLDAHQMPPRYLLMDEPTAALDLVQQHRLFATARRLTRAWNIGALAIAHDCNLAARHADRLVLIANGRSIADGAPREVMRTDLLERCYGAPMQIASHDQDAVASIFPA
ncbi:ABC-type hemin transport system ATPase subunit [Paraburkholderia bannensis]|uniref:ABC-type hemin transport system ATPase subunit n=1 Tax=Paraburkholderia bannensis TaxID=765414 RepID=A0A7W9TVV2_9BURK|nr:MULTISPECIES: hypothetical protein [Paraburkholderia]MBB3257282.1 ABC-type hemin transport system ATPase subunit [Paraburkholderia sp. WP4_3_2]MBB6102322.1 ABC-type hemin transport system ATPase subunit [Paraburkholderia bannensis]